MQQESDITLVSMAPTLDLEQGFGLCHRIWCVHAQLRSTPLQLVKLYIRATPLTQGQYKPVGLVISSGVQSGSGLVPI